MNYRIIKDSFYSHIAKTDADADSQFMVFTTYKEAKKHLLLFLRSQRDSWVESYNKAIHDAKVTTEQDLQDDQNI
jgi:hypothetical protein